MSKAIYGIKAPAFEKSDWPIGKEIQVSDVRKSENIHYWKGTIYSVEDTGIIILYSDHYGKPTFVEISIDDYLDEIYKLVVIG